VAAGFRELQVAVGKTEFGDILVSARELYRFFHAGDDETFALRGVSVDVRAGEVVAIVGPSGSGKSTLLACLAGLDEPDGGHVVVGGERITRRPEVERASIRARWIGVLLQSGNLLEHLSVSDNVRAARALHPSTGPRTEDLLRGLGLSKRGGAIPSTLSGGESARAGLAVALANHPRIVVADEPTGEVDAANEERVLALLRKRSDAGGAVIVATHSDRVARAADRTLRLVDGRIVDE
jgi:putative ABC transport system ATP-binding protein